ncbi:MAG: peptidoglycan editing factor PgeF [Bacteroidetes bacterium]|nr:MAG: peptidoglycan editing factor PgeF [Bacteroidota bacterium]
MIEINEPVIFDKSKIISGITKRNINEFPPNGFSISPAGDFYVKEANNGRKYLAEYLKKKYPSIKKVIFQKQVHGDKIEIVDSNSIEGLEQEREVRDGMICFEKGIVLCVSLADCAGILIYDQKKEAVAAIHSGWKGTSLDIAGKGIELMKKHGSNPKDMQVWISPSASGEKYEVGYDVAKYFIDNEGNHLNPPLKKVAIIPLSPPLIKGKKKYLFDNKLQIKNQLISAGVKEEYIEISEICTIKDIEYHSYRRDKNLSGRMGTFIGMI